MANLNILQIVGELQIYLQNSIVLVFIASWFVWKLLILFEHKIFKTALVSAEQVMILKHGYIWSFSDCF